MGFHEGAFATVWKIEDTRDRFSKLRISISRKDANTDTYVTDFSGFVSLYSQANQKIGLIENALKQTGRCRIKLCSDTPDRTVCDVSTQYDKETDREYVNYKLFDFQMVDGTNTGTAPAKSNTTPARTNNKSSGTAHSRNNALSSLMNDDIDDESDVLF